MQNLGIFFVLSEALDTIIKPNQINHKPFHLSYLYSPCRYVCPWQQETRV